MTVSENRLGLEVILKYIQCSSKCIAGLDTFTYPYTSGTQVVQSAFTLQQRYRASPVFLWSCHGDCKLTCLFNNEDVFFRHFVNHPQGLPHWLKFEWACFTCSSLPLPVCLYCLLKIAIFLVKTHNCQRMSWVCVHNASSIVCFP